jgi:hypothetical protein
VASLFYFLIGCLVLVVVLYAIHLVLPWFALPAEVNRLVMLIVGALGLIALLYLAYRALFGPAGLPP